MAPGFRLATRPAASETMSQFTVDFSADRAGLQRLDFLPVPKAPEIDAPSCVARDNNITVAWADRPATAATTDESNAMIWNTGSLKFDSRFVVVRVRARTKRPPATSPSRFAVPTAAFAFVFDGSSAHAELRVQSDTVTWEPQGVKGHDARLRGKENKSSRSATPSPNKTAGSRGARDRFAGESVHRAGRPGDGGGGLYWALRPLADWKSFSANGCRARSLPSTTTGRRRSDWPLPQRIGIFCDYDNGDLIFIDVDRLRLLHSFKTKFNQPLVPAFTVWCGGIALTTGLQVPSFMGNFLSTNQSLSNLSP
ncbi:hypothetical protein KUCAC02_036571 [Chaenocephalus aceratus]|nr:hypothetical protein KUCAC02_036571 [Chaenocephalus aceratus]